MTDAHLDIIPGRGRLEAGLSTAILHAARTDCQWRMLPKEFPPRRDSGGYARWVFGIGTPPVQSVDVSTEEGNSRSS